MGFSVCLARGNMCICNMRHLGVVHVDVRMCLHVQVHVCICTHACMNMEHGMSSTSVCACDYKVWDPVSVVSGCAHVCACRLCCICVYDVCRGRQGVVCACRLCVLVCVHMQKQTNRQTPHKQKGRQHSDFPGGHPPEYYPSLRLLNFAKRTGYGALSLRWPSTLTILYPSHTHLSTHTCTQNEWSTRARPNWNLVH